MQSTNILRHMYTVFSLVFYLAGYVRGLKKVWFIGADFGDKSFAEHYFQRDYKDSYIKE